MRPGFGHHQRRLMRAADRRRRKIQQHMARSTLARSILATLNPSLRPHATVSATVVDPQHSCMIPIADCRPRTTIRPRAGPDRGAAGKPLVSAFADR